MKLEGFAASSLRIPFKGAFRHASAERAETQTLWVEARADGAIGYGEGCPREYVTGESLAGALAFCEAHAAEWRTCIRDLDTLGAWAARHQAAIGRNPSAWCAVELALLDLIGKLEHRPVEAVLGLPALSGRFRYTAVLGDGPRAQFEAQLAHYLQAGFRDFKIKLSGDPSRDGAKARALEAAGVRGNAVRADANNLWADAGAAIAALEAMGFGFCALEEPLQAGDYRGMGLIAEALDTRVVLDESVVRPGQLDALGADAKRWIVNLRVSKMGGVLRSLAMVAELRRRRLAVVIGAHVGETSVLTRAGLTVAAAARDILFAQEGAFGTHLLARDVAEPPLMFGAGGVLTADAAPLQGEGWGLTIAVAPADLTR